jgi:hypothetical protein
MKVAATTRGTVIRVYVYHAVDLRQESDNVICYRRGAHSCISNKMKLTKVDNGTNYISLGEYCAWRDFITSDTTECDISVFISENKEIIEELEQLIVNTESQLEIVNKEDAIKNKKAIDIANLINALGGLNAEV